jgi:hypothetical protein
MAHGSIANCRPPASAAMPGRYSGASSVANTVASSASTGLRPSIAAIAAALPTGGANMQISSPSFTSPGSGTMRASATATAGTPKVAHASSTASRRGRANGSAKSLRRTFMNAPSVKVNTASPINGRAHAASGGSSRPSSTPKNSNAGPRRPANSSKRVRAFIAPPRA